MVELIPMSGAMRDLLTRYQFSGAYELKSVGRIPANGRAGIPMSEAKRDLIQLEHIVILFRISFLNTIDYFA
jgi:hypothetical protein